MTPTVGTDPRPLVDRARAAVPGLSQVTVTLTAVAECIRVSAAIGQPENEEGDRIAQAIVDTGVIPDNVAERILAVRHANARAYAEGNVLRSAETRLRHRWGELHRQHAGAALRIIATEIAEIIDTARPILDDLDGIPDADTAITEGHADTWRALTQLGDRYLSARGVQFELITTALDPQGMRDHTALVLDYGHVRRPWEHYPDVDRAEPQPTESLNVQHGGQPTHNRPWLAPHPVDSLRFAARPDVEVWVPAPDELTSARDAHRAHRRAAALAAEAEQLATDPDARARAASVRFGARVAGITPSH